MVLGFLAKRNYNPNPHGSTKFEQRQYALTFLGAHHTMNRVKRITKEEPKQLITKSQRKFTIPKSESWLSYGNEYMRHESESHITRRVETHYKMEVDSLARIYKGMGTRNWLLRTTEGRFFVKEYHTTSDLHAERQALGLTEYAYKCGIPTPKIIRTGSSDLMCVDDGTAFTLFQYVPGTTSHGCLSINQMAEAGRTLGDIHRHFKRVKTERASTVAEWLNFDENRKSQEIKAYLKIIAHKEKPDDFDEKTYELLLKRKELLKEVSKILNRVSDLTAQVIHNDYSGLNLMFSGDKLNAVIDFNPPTPFLISYEIGRIALSPENLCLPDWREKAVVLIKEYCGANKVALKDVFFAPHMWLVQLIRSTYGVKQHYTNPHELQNELDNFWFQRAHAAELILENIVNLEKIFEDVWQEQDQYTA